MLSKIECGEGQLLESLTLYPLCVGCLHGAVLAQVVISRLKGLQALVFFDIVLMAFFEIMFKCLLASCAVSVEAEVPAQNPQPECRMNASAGGDVGNGFEGITTATLQSCQLY